MNLDPSSFYAAPPVNPEAEATSAPPQAGLEATASKYLTSADWVHATPEKRQELAGDAALATIHDLEKQKDLKVPGKVKDADGNEVDGQVPAFDSKGNYTPDGEKLLGQANRLFKTLATDPTGGMMFNEVTKKYEPTYGPQVILDKLEDQDKKELNGPFSKLESFGRDWETRIKDDSPMYDEDGILQPPKSKNEVDKKPSYADYAEYFNSHLDPDSPAHLDPANKEMAERFDSVQRRVAYDPASMSDTKPLDVVEGQVVFNPRTFNMIDDVENAISKLDPEKFDSMDRRIVLQNYKKLVNEQADSIAKSFWAENAGMTGVVADVFRKEMGGDIQDMRYRLAQWKADGGSGYDFMKANKDLINRDSFGFFHTLSNSLRNNVLEAYVGSMAVAGGLISNIAGDNGVSRSLAMPSMMFEGFRGLEKQAETVGAFKVPFFGFETSTSEIAELGGMVGSMFVIGAGMKVAAIYSSWGVENLMMNKAIAITAKEAGVAASELDAGQLALARAAGSKAFKEGMAEKALMKTADAAEAAALPYAEVKKWGKDMLTDPAAHMMGFQMAGVGFGEGYWSYLKEHPGDVEGAYKEGQIKGVSDYFAATISSAVMHRLAPGAARAVIGDTSSMSGSFIQNLRARTANRAGMLETRSAIEALVGDPEIVKAVMPALRAEIDSGIKKAGLRGFGLAADIGSQFTEMTMMPALGDMFHWMQDDSKRWEDADVWKGISENFHSYVRSGVMGALMGAGGGLPHALHGETLGRAEAKAKIQREVTLRWKAIEANVGKFAKDPDAYADFSQSDPRTMAQLLATPTEHMSNAEKAELFVIAARRGPRDLTGNLIKKEPTSPTPSDPATPATPAVDPSDPEKAIDPSAEDSGEDESTPAPEVLSLDDARERVRASNVLTDDGGVILHKNSNGDVIEMRKADKKKTVMTMDEAVETLAEQLVEQHAAEQKDKESAGEDHGESVAGSKGVSFRAKDHTFWKKLKNKFVQIGGITGLLGRGFGKSDKSQKSAGEKAMLDAFADAGTKGHEEITDALIRENKGEAHPKEMSTRTQNVIDALKAVPGYDPSRPFLVEHRLAHPGTDVHPNGYAGIIDVAVPVEGGYHLVELKLKDSDANPHDSKSKFHRKFGKTSPADLYAIQLEAQKRAMEANGEKVVGASVLAFDSGGNPKRTSMPGKGYTFENTHYKVFGKEGSSAETLAHADRIYGKAADVSQTKTSSEEKPSGAPPSDSKSKPPTPNGQNDQTKQAESQAENGKGQVLKGKPLPSNSVGAMPVVTKKVAKDLGGGVRIMYHVNALGQEVAVSTHEMRPIIWVEDAKGRGNWFYQSFSGTDGKAQGHWYPVGGVLNDRSGWIIKGDPHKDPGYGRPALARLVTIVDNALPHTDTETEAFLKEITKGKFSSFAENEDNPQTSSGKGSNDTERREMINKWKVDYLNKVWGHRGEDIDSPKPTAEEPSSAAPVNIFEIMKDDGRKLVALFKQRNPAILEKLTDLHAKDLTAKQIAKELGLDTNTVRSLRLGLDLPEQGKPSAGLGIGTTEADPALRAKFEKWVEDRKSNPAEPQVKGKVLTALFEHPLVKALAKRILGDNVQIKSYDSAEARDLDLGGKSATPYALGWRGAAFIKEYGTRIIALNSQHNFSRKELVKVIIHEFFHIKDIEFSQTEDGGKLRETAMRDAIGDSYLEAAMRREYNGYAGLDAASKFSEVVRAVIEGRLLGYTSESGSGLATYLRALLDHVKTVFHGNTETGKYLDEVQARVESVIGDVDAYHEHIDRIAQEELPEAVAKAVASELHPEGGGEWTPEVSKAFHEHLADWIAGARTMSTTIQSALAAVWKAMKKRKPKETQRIPLSPVPLEAKTEGEKLEEDEREEAVRPSLKNDYEARMDASVFIRQKDLDDGKDKFGAEWKQLGENDYSYTVPKGSHLALGINSIVEIVGKDQKGKVLTLDSMHSDAAGDMVYSFRKVDLSEAYDFTKGEWKAFNDKNDSWHRNTLGDVAIKIAAHVQHLAASDASRLDANRMRDIFGVVMDSIAPEMKDRFTETTAFNNGEFATTRVVDGKPVITVNYTNMARRMNSIFGQIKTDSPEPGRTKFNNTLLATEMARVVSNYISEETIHSVARFTKDEVDRFADSAVELSNQKGFDILRKLFFDTIRERFDPALVPVLGADGKWDASAVKAAPGVMENVALEVMRQLVQLRNTGTTTEMSERMAMALSGAVRGDVQAEDTGRGWMKAARTFALLIARYTSQLRNKATEMFLRGRLTPEMRSMLDDLNADFMKSGVKSDVDMTNKARLENGLAFRNQFRDAGNQMLHQEAMGHTGALQELRRVVSHFGALGPEDIVELDFKSLQMRLKPDIAEYLREVTPHINVDAIDAALNAMNSVGALSQVAGQIVNNRAVLDAARADLPFNLSELFNRANPLHWSNDTLKMLAAIATKTGEKGLRLMTRQIDSEIGTLEDDRAREQRKQDVKALQHVANLDLGQSGDMAQAMRIAQRLGVEMPTADEVASASWPKDVMSPKAEVSPINLWQGRLLALAENHATFHPGELPGKVWEDGRGTGELGVLDGQIADLTSRRSIIQQIGAEFGSVPDAGERRNRMQRFSQLEAKAFHEDGQELATGVNEGTPESDTVNALRKQNVVDRVRQHIEDMEKTAGVRRVEIDTAFDQYDTYAKALAEYDDSVRYATRIALGDSKLDTREFAQQWFDLSGYSNGLAKDLEDREAIRAGGYMMTDPDTGRVRPMTPKERDAFDAAIQKDTATLDKVRAKRFDSIDKLVDVEGNLDNVWGTHYEDIDHSGPPSDSQIAADIRQREDNNAAFRGREHFVRFLASKALGGMPADLDTQVYSSLGGFAAVRQYDTETRRWVYPGPEKIFPVFGELTAISEFSHNLNKFQLNDADEKFPDGMSSEAKDKLRVQRFVRTFGTIKAHDARLRQIKEWIGTIEKAISEEFDAVPEHPEDAMDLAEIEALGKQPKRDKIENVRASLRTTLPDGRETLAAGPAQILRARIADLRIQLEAHQEFFNNNTANLMGPLERAELVKQAEAWRAWDARDLSDTSLTRPDFERPVIKPVERFNIDLAHKFMGNNFDKENGSNVGLKQVVAGLWLLDHDVKLSRTALRNFLKPESRSNTERELTHTQRDAGYIPTHGEFSETRGHMVDFVTLQNLNFAGSYYNGNPVFGIGAVWAQDSLLEIQHAHWGAGGKQIFANRSNQIDVNSGGSLLDQQPMNMARQGDLDSENRFPAQGTAGNQPFTDEDVKRLKEGSNLKEVDQPHQMLKRALTRAAWFIGSRNGDPMRGEQFVYDLDAYDHDSVAARKNGITLAGLLDRAIQGLFHMENTYGKAGSGERLIARREEFLNEWGNSKYAKEGKLSMEGFLTDLLEFKAKKEQAEIERQRLESVSQIQDALDTVGNARRAKVLNPEKGGKKYVYDHIIKPKQMELIHKMMFKNNVSAEHPFMLVDAQSITGDGEMSYVSSNPVVSMLLQKAGKTMVYVANEKLLREHEDISENLVFIPGYTREDGSTTPNVIFMTARSHETDKPLMQEQEQRTMEHFFVTMGNRNEALAGHLADFASNIRGIIDMTNVLTTMRDRLWEQGKAWQALNPQFLNASKKVRALAEAKAGEAASEESRTLAGQTAVDGFMKSVDDYLDKMAMLTKTLNGGERARAARAELIDGEMLEQDSGDATRPVVAHPEDRNFMEYQKGGKGLVDNAVLIAQILSNPDMKLVYDTLHIQPEEFDVAGLDHRTAEALIDGIVKMSAPHAWEADVAPWAAEEVSNESAADLSGVEPGKTQDWQGVLDSYRSILHEAAQESRRESSIVEAAAGMRLELINAGVVPRITPGMANAMFGLVGDFSDSDKSVFNFLARFISQTKSEQVAPDNIETDARGRYKVDVNTLRNKASRNPSDAGDLQPLMSARRGSGVNVHGNADGRYTTNWMNVARPTVGEHTILPLQFYKRRLEFFTNGMVGYSETGKGALHEFLWDVIRTKASSEKTPEKALKRLLDSKKSDAKRTLTLDQAFVDDIGGLFTPGQLEENIGLVRRALTGLRETIATRTGELEDARAEQAGLLEQLKDPTNGFREVTGPAREQRLAEVAGELRTSLREWVASFRKNDNDVRRRARLIADQVDKFGTAGKDVVQRFYDLIYNDFDQSNINARAQGLVDEFNEFANREIAQFKNLFQPDEHIFPLDSKFLPEIKLNIRLDKTLAAMDRFTRSPWAAENIQRELQRVFQQEVDSRRNSELGRKISDSIGEVRDMTNPEGLSNLKPLRRPEGGELSGVLLSRLANETRGMSVKEANEAIDRMFVEAQAAGQDLSAGKKYAPGKDYADWDNKPLLGADALHTGSILDFLTSLAPSESDAASVNSDAITSRLRELADDIKARQDRLDQMNSELIRRTNVHSLQAKFDVVTRLPENEVWKGNTDVLKVPLLLKSESGDAAGAEDFHVRLEALHRTMKDFYDHGAEDAFKMFKGGDEQFLNYDVEKMMGQVIRNVQVQNSVVNSRWKTFRDAGGNELSAEGISAMMIPGELDLAIVRQLRDNAPRVAEIDSRLEALKAKLEDGALPRLGAKDAFRKELNALSVERAKLVDTTGRVDVNVSKASRIRRIVAVDNYAARTERIGRFLESEEGDMMYLPVSARADLDAYFKGRDQKVPVDAALRDIVLNASTAPVVGDAASYRGYGLGYTDKQVDAPFHETDQFPITRDWQAKHPGDVLTFRQAANLFSAKQRAQVIEAINSRAFDEHNVSTGRLIDLANLKKSPALKAQLDYQTELLEKIIHSYRLADPALPGTPVISNETRLKIKILLNRLETEHFVQGGSGDKMGYMSDMRLLDLYGDVFADIEGQRTMQRMVAGLNGNISQFQLTMLEWVHSQDSRTRHRFLKDFVAYQEAVRMQGYLENGFAGNTGRNGHLFMFKKGEHDIETFAKPLGNNWMHQSTGSIIASLEGTDRARGKHVSENLDRWFSVLKSGVSELEKYVKAQEDHFGFNLKGDKVWKVKKGINEFFNAEHIDLTEDLAGVREIWKTVSSTYEKMIGAPFEDSSDSEGNGPSTDTAEVLAVKDAQARAMIAAVREALLSSKHVGEARDRVQKYADNLGGMFQDLSDAASVNNILLSHENTTEEIDEMDRLKNSSDPKDKEKWEGRYSKKIRPYLNQYSTFPLHLSRAQDPGANRLQLGAGKHKSDPMESVSPYDASISSTGLKSKYDPDSQFRPINLNGLSAPEAIMRDTSYRMNVGPNYRILRDLLGLEIKTKGNMSTVVGERKLLSKLVNTEDEKINSKVQHIWKVTLAVLAHEVENNILNDGAIGAHNTKFAKVLQHLSTAFTFRALFSIQQIPQQTLPAIAGVLAKKLVTCQWEDAKFFLEVLKTTGMGAMPFMSRFDVTADNDSAGSPTLSLNRKIKDFVKETSGWVNFRGSEGMDPYKDLKRNQVKFGSGKVDGMAKLGVRKYTGYQEWGMEQVIARWERPISQAIYIMELRREMIRAEDRQEMSNAPRTLLELLDKRHADIPEIAIQHAQIKVSDHMGQADQSKKSWVFQSMGQNPSLHHALRTLVRFSNHTATTASNLAALQEAIRFGNREFARDAAGNKVMDPATGKWKVVQYDPEMRRQAIENLTGTLVQNVLFQFTKAQVVVPIMAAIAGMMGGKDKDEAIREGQDLADRYLQAGNDDSWGKKLAQRVLFGTARPLFSENKPDERAARYSAMAEMGSKTILELGQAIPALGVLMGYAPVVDAMRPVVQQGTSEGLSYLSSLLGDKIQTGVQGISVPKYNESAIGLMTGVTAPSSFLYDALMQGNKAYNSSTGTDATKMDVMLYVLSELMGTRELRTGMDKELTQHLRDASLEGH